MMDAQSPAFVALGSPNFAATMAFYEGLTGQPPQAYRPDRYGEFFLGDLKIAIFRPHPDHCTQFRQPAGSMGLCVPVPDLDQTLERLRDLPGARWGEVQVSSHGREVYCFDPAENRLIFYQAFAPNPALPSV